MQRLCLLCRSPIQPSRPPWTVWCSDACRFRAYRQRRRYLAETLEGQIAKAVREGREREAEALIEGALPSLRSRLRGYLARQLRAREELERQQERLRDIFERWLATRHRRLRATGHLRPRLFLLPEEPRRGERRPPFPCERCHEPLAFEIAPGLAHCARCGARFPIA